MTSLSWKMLEKSLDSNLKPRTTDKEPQHCGLEAVK